MHDSRIFLAISMFLMTAFDAQHNFMWPKYFFIPVARLLCFGCCNQHVSIDIDMQYVNTRIKIVTISCFKNTNTNTNTKTKFFI